MGGGFSTATGVAHHVAKDDAGVENRIEQSLLGIEPEEPEETAR